MQFCTYEDSAFRQFHPLTYLRPVFDLRCGFWTLRQRIGLCLPQDSALAGLTRTALAPLAAEGDLRAPKSAGSAPIVLINGRALGDKALRKLLSGKLPIDTVYRNANDVVVASVGTDTFRKLRRDADGAIAANAFDRLQVKTVSTQTARYAWDLVTGAANEIARDAADFGASLPAGVKKKPSGGAQFVNPSAIRIGAGTALKPGVVLDAEHGPIILGRNVRVLANAVIEGPAAIGDGTIVKAGAKIYGGTAIGERCKIGGEVESSIVQSYANKQHDGFLGHSYLGSWVNLGADTNTSDLKNTYGPIAVDLDGVELKTGLTFLGLIAGDHAKTGINMMFNTGTIMGVGCNLFGAQLPPKAVPSFSWGSGERLEEYDLEKCLATARVVMARREIRMSKRYEQLFRDVFAATRRDRLRTGVR